MDKPISMSVKDYLVRTLAVKILTSEKIVETVIDHQFQSANEAMDLNNSVEIAGFGKFFFNNKKAITRLKSLEVKLIALTNILNDVNSSEKKKHSASVTIEKTIAQIKSLKERTNEKH